jgi:hypothetical protein
MQDQVSNFEPIALSAESLSIDAGNGFSLSTSDFSSPSASRVETQFIKPPMYVGTRRAPLSYDHAQKLTDEMGGAILAGERVDALVSGSFVFGDFIEALCVTLDVLVKRMTISTLSLAPENVVSLSNLIKGDYLRHLDIVVSDYWYSHQKRNVPYVLEYLAGDPRCPFRLAVAGTHTKFVLIETEAGQKIVMHGSANLRSSKSVEYLTIESCDALYDFHVAWHDRILGAYEVKPKAIRHGNLWRTIHDKT